MTRISPKFHEKLKLDAHLPRNAATQIFIFKFSRNVKLFINFISHILSDPVRDRSHLIWDGTFLFLKKHNRHHRHTDLDGGVRWLSHWGMKFSGEKSRLWTFHRVPHHFGLRSPLKATPHTSERFHHDQLNPIMNGAINMNIYFSSSPVSAPASRHFRAGANLPLERHAKRLANLISFMGAFCRSRGTLIVISAASKSFTCRPVMWHLQVFSQHEAFIFNSALFFALTSRKTTRRIITIAIPTPSWGANTPNECVEMKKQSLHPRAKMGSGRRCRGTHFCEFSPWWMAARAEK